MQHEPVISRQALGPSCVSSRVASSVRELGGRGEIRRLLSLIVYRQGLSAIGYRDRHLKKKAGRRGCDLLFVLRTRSR
jgi:hypothetical protein